MTGALVRRGNLDTGTHRRKRIWRDTERRWPSASQAERPGTDPSLIASEGTNPAPTLVLDFQPPELRDKTFLLLKPLCLWPFVTSPSTPIPGLGASVPRWCLSALVTRWVTFLSPNDRSFLIPSPHHGGLTASSSFYMNASWPHNALRSPLLLSPWELQASPKCNMTQGLGKLLWLLKWVHTKSQRDGRGSGRGALCSPGITQWPFFWRTFFFLGDTQEVADPPSQLGVFWE